MSCKYNNCEICGYKTGCEIYKENTELKKACDETQELLDKQIEATYKLDEENAELKEQLEIEQNARGDWFGKAVTKDRRLTEAKEIIKNLLFLHNDKFGSTRLEWRCNVVAEAEQFLNEVEK